MFCVFDFSSYFTAYDGRVCENDANGCNAISCLPGQSCEDNRAPDSGAICACPMGYLVINSKCVGKI